MWHDEAMQLLLQAYGEIPPPVISRVKVIVDKMYGPSPTTEGITYNEAREGDVDIEIADATYDIEQVVEDPENGTQRATSEEEFKATLVHELFHYVENNTQSVDPATMLTPETLKAVLVQPAIGGFPAFTFGWFDAGVIAAHLDNVSTGPLSPLSPDSPAARAKAAGAYEASPDGRGLEEDLATSVAMYLTSPGTRGHLQKVYPKRYDLIDRHFGTLKARAAASR